MHIPVLLCKRLIRTFLWNYLSWNGAYDEPSYYMQIYTLCLSSMINLVIGEDELADPSVCPHTMYRYMSSSPTVPLEGQGYY